VPWRHDPHADHEAAVLIGEAAARFANAYPVWDGPSCPMGRARSSGRWLEIQLHLAVKRRATAAHASQYGGLIDDDPTGFQLSVDLLSIFDAPWETFLLP